MSNGWRISDTLNGMPELLLAVGGAMRGGVELRFIWLEDRERVRERKGSIELYHNERKVQLLWDALSLEFYDAENDFYFFFFSTVRREHSWQWWGIPRRDLNRGLRRSHNLTDNEILLDYWSRMKMIERVIFRVHRITALGRGSWSTPKHLSW